MAWENNLNYDRFITMFQEVFDHSPDGREMSEMLLAIKQGNKCTAEYNMEFRTLASTSRWNDITLHATYRQELNNDVLKEMACRDEPLSLDALIHMSIKLDDLLKERPNVNTCRLPQYTTSFQRRS